MFPLYSCRLLVWLVGGFLALWMSTALSGLAKAGDVLTQRYDTARTGSTTQPGLNPQAVQGPDWGELGRLPVNGIVTRSRSMLKTYKPGASKDATSFSSRLAVTRSMRSMRARSAKCGTSTSG